MTDLEREQRLTLICACEFILSGNSDDPEKAAGWIADLKREYPAKMVGCAAELLNCLNEVMAGDHTKDPIDRTLIILFAVAEGACRG